MFANNNQSLTKSKHINIKYLVVIERVQNGQLSTEHIGTNSMIVEPLTKVVSATVLHEHTTYMSLTSYEDMFFSGSLVYFVCLLCKRHVV